MTASEMVRAALAATGKTQKELAEHMGWSKQNLSQRLKNDTLTFNELSKALDFAGYSVKMVNAGGTRLLNMNNSESPRAVQMVGGVTYDTSKAESLCSNRLPDGAFYSELFRAASGAHFMVSYTLMDEVEYTISPIPKEIARQVWEQYTGRPSEEME